MNPNAGQTLNSPLRSAVVVAPHPADLKLITDVVPASEFAVTVAQAFADAKALIVASPPTLLITDLRLGEYNGLHLILRAKAMRPDMAAVVLSDLADRELQAEAERLGATFVAKPVSREELAAAIFRTLHRTSGDRTPIRPPFERRVVGRRETSLDVQVTDRRQGDRRRIPFGLIQLT